MPRLVEASADYWSDVSRSFPDERGPAGEPCRADYEQLEHPRIAAAFASDFDEMHQFITGRPDYREHAHIGLLAPIVLVRAQLRADGVVELLEAIIDTDWSRFS